MPAEYIRRYYKMDYKRGDRVIVDGRHGMITSFPGQYINMRFDGDKHATPCHPIWRFKKE